jgi:hypothetical protein
VVEIEQRQASHWSAFVLRAPRVMSSAASAAIEEWAVILKVVANAMRVAA